MKKKYTLVVSEKSNERIDVFVTRSLKDISRSMAQHLIRDGNIKVNDAPIKPGYHIKHDDIVTITVPAPVPIDIAPEDIAIDVLYEDTDIIAVNKPAGMVVHPAAGHISGTLVNALLHHCTDLSAINGVLRPGIVHRLDKDTSGVIIAAKNDIAHQKLAHQFAKRKTVKEYRALVYGHIRAGLNKHIDAPIGRHPTNRKKMAVTTLEHGKSAETTFSILALWEDMSYLSVRLLTGRTHQIRVHLAHIGYPIIGDDTYGGKKRSALPADFNVTRQLLHAYHLRIAHPITMASMDFYAPIPEDMHRILQIKGYKG
ncbi:MAG: RluA family pseudouridine synthase [bacterium]|nr:RluA family pseudouridine synthase [bacterium]